MDKCEMLYVKKGQATLFYVMKKITHLEVMY